MIRIISEHRFFSFDELTFDLSRVCITDISCLENCNFFQTNAIREQCVSFKKILNSIFSVAFSDYAIFLKLIQKFIFTDIELAQHLNQNF